ncbi:MAG: nucleotide pyrophosphohydrolase [Anaerotruncus sp.]|nr:nucleotide pyrophosphohydrolase [Anaerotruncus sp.]
MNAGGGDDDTPEALAKSIIIEAAELLENYQWADTVANPENVREELADVLMCAPSDVRGPGVGSGERSSWRRSPKTFEKYPLEGLLNENQ